MSPSQPSGSERGGRRTGLLPIVAAAAVVVLLVVVVGAYAYDSSRSGDIARGVKIAGINVGGLDEAAARQRVQAELGARLGPGVTVTSGSRSWTFTAREAHLHINVANMVSQAESVSHEGSFLSRTARELTGGGVNREIALVETYSHPQVHALLAKVSAAVDQQPLDATVEPSASGLRSVPGRTGEIVDVSALGGRIDRSLIGVSPARTIHIPTREVQPAVTTAQLAAKYPAYIVVDRATFKLMFYEHLKLAKTFEIAVGMEGLETPAGLHKIEWEQEDPSWYVPKKAWAGALAGTVVPPGPNDPIKARFMSFDGGAGIHGIDPSEYSSIGHDASHGCVRMRIPDVIDLYSHSPVGTPVYII
jgi:lipoprotein-anchoring transpeptidase ErfK/SrfK